MFSDAGRVSRGGVGTQGKFLKIFEKNGFPIPDLVAVRDGQILVIEIDSSLAKVCKSLRTYRRVSAPILTEVNRFALTDKPISKLLTGFCRMGLTRDIGPFLKRHFDNPCDIDVLIAFDMPGEPRSFRMDR